ncbi:DUF4102 domain-containing protein [Tabrizicola sp. WMC-M-20]|nr:DUF4102 domain-containing protein [Tabrizicola sp. WMC-M-20]
MPKLTKRIINAVEPQATEFFLWDEGIPGFGLRVMPGGRKSFVVQFRAGRRARRMSLGPATVLTGDQARTRAITCVGRMNGYSRPSAAVDVLRGGFPEPDITDWHAATSATGVEIVNSCQNRITNLQRQEIGSVMLRSVIRNVSDPAFG